MVVLPLVKKIIIRAIRSKSRVINKPRPFKKIPGPLSLPLLGTVWKYVFNWDIMKLHETSLKRLNEYGVISRERVFNKYDTVHIYQPEDIVRLFQNEGRYPERFSQVALGHYRLKKPHLYNSEGMLPGNGVEWWRVRSVSQKHTSNIEEARRFLPYSEEIRKDFMKQLSELENSTIDDFMPLIFRFHLELIWMFIFGKRLNSFSPANMTKNSIPTMLIEATDEINNNALTNDNIDWIWKRYPKLVPSYRKFEKGVTFLESILIEAINDSEAEISLGDKKTNEESFMLEKLFHNPNIDRKDINAIIMDLIMGGIDAPSYINGFLMYNLARNPNVQRKIRDEAMAVLPDPDSKLSSDFFDKSQYSKAVMKESLRLNPLTPGIGRILKTDIVLANYIVPKGTLVATHNMLISRSEQFFKNAMEFIPERHMKDSSHYEKGKGFFSLPFSIGPRNCVAQKLAEQNVLSFMMGLMKTYNVQWKGKGDLGITTPMLCTPDKPITLSFHKWNNSNISIKI